MTMMMMMMITDRMWRGLCGKDRIHLSCSSGLDDPHQL